MITAKTKFRPKDYTKIFCKLVNMPLSTDEQKLYDALCLVNTDSYYGKVILDVFANYSIERFRQLVEELLQQRDDASYEVYKMLGKDAYDCLLALKRNSNE